MTEIFPIPPQPLTAEEEPSGTPPSLIVVPGLLDQPVFTIREDGDTDEDFDASNRLLAAALAFARRA